MIFPEDRIRTFILNDRGSHLIAWIGNLCNPCLAGYMLGALATVGGF